MSTTDHADADTRQAPSNSIAQRAVLAVALVCTLGVGGALDLVISDRSHSVPAAPAAVVFDSTARPGTGPTDQRALQVLQVVPGQRVSAGEGGEPADSTPAGAPAAPAGVPGVGKIYGDPTAAAPYWRPQHSSDCGEMSVADVVGQITGNEPTEQDVITMAEHTPSKSHAGSIWHPGADTTNLDVAVLLQRYGIHAVSSQTGTSGVPTGIDALEQSLAHGDKLIVGVNAETIWNKPGNHSREDHFVVVTGIDSRAGVVHLNDSGVKTGQDEQVPIATFTQAWATSHDDKTVATGK